MTDEVKQPDPLDSKVLTLSLTVAQINHILQILGEAPYVKSVAPINWINEQGIPQFQKMLEEEKAKDEPQAIT